MRDRSRTPEPPGQVYYSHKVDERPATHLNHSPSPPPPVDLYDLYNLRHCPEDIVICVDVDREIDTEMKVPAVKGAPPSGTITRLDAVRQALLLFIHSKLQIDPSHRFAIVTLADNPCWLTRGFIGDVGTLTHAVRSLRSTGVYPTANLQGLLQAVAAEARLSLSLGHCPRLVLIYSRSGVVPYMAPHSQAPHPQAQQHDVAGLFTTDVVYLHHKPSESTSWQQPQEIFDRLVSCLEQISAHEAYIFESSRWGPREGEGLGFERRPRV
eukprot:jgi/Mesen1/6485/ME000331S05601